MKILSLRLRSFRSYEQLQLCPPDGVTVLVGENGAGKTNLLEAVHLCCLGKSHRTGNDRDMIRSGADSAAVQLTVKREDGVHDVGVRLYEAQRRKKLIYINGKTAPRIGELFGHATAVIFSPEDLRTVRDGPEVRRHFMDMLLCQRQKSYFYALQMYTAALRHRNALLKGEDLRQLDAWDEELCRAAGPLVQCRRALAGELDRCCRDHYLYIGGKDDEVFSVAYRGHLENSPDVYADMRRGLERAREEDIRRQTTTFGPHRDDLNLTLSGNDMRAFASQGQVRTAALSMKLAAFDALEKTQGEPPLLLLDDVLSELDPERRRRLLGRVKHVQTLLTCTDLSDLTGADPACILKVENGTLTEIGG
ncbi:MAG: DNA replication/repair protein RecF [Clostridia bacterium]|nr:DNA replication/repair protein RecF [Clostridia bacterium]